MLAQQPEVQFEPNSAPIERACALLASLQKAHVRLLSAIQNLTRITGRPSADRLEYSAVRFRVSEASLARRIAVRDACDYILEVGSPSDQQAISRLRKADSDLARHASQHVNRWTTDQVGLDWGGYCSASKEIRRALLKQMELERAMLCPLLHKHSSNRPDHIRLIPIDRFIAEESGRS